MAGRVGRRTGVVAAAAMTAALMGCSTAGGHAAKRPASGASNVGVTSNNETVPPTAAAHAEGSGGREPRAARAEKPALPARGGTAIITNYNGPISVPTGQSVLLRLASAAERVAIADPEVAEVVLISPREILVNGKGRKKTETHTTYMGDTSKIEVLDEAKTSLIVWDKSGNSDIRTLYVNKARTEQVMLEVTVADLNRSALENTGFDFLFNQGNVVVSGLQSKLFNPNQFTPTLNQPSGPIPTNLAPQIDRLSYLLWSVNDDFIAFIELLQRESLAKILARPTILARSGEEAHFRVGGEIPIVYATNNVATITWKEFGVIVHVTPTLADDGEIDMRLSTEVSQPVNTGSVSLAGFSLPEFVSRKADTRVKIAENASLMIGGLYREDETEREDKTPYVGDLPYLGALFRRTTFERTKNELLIVVRPRVVRNPSDVTPTSLPTDRPPLSRSEVRTKDEPQKVTRPRLGGGSDEEPVWPSGPAPNTGLPLNP